jgi:MOSC domain-containing protein YiiM
MASPDIVGTKMEDLIDSSSPGDPSRHLPLDDLERGLAALPETPANVGRLALIVRKGEGGRRETPDQVRLTPDAGLPGDAWGRRQQPNPEAQLAVMQTAVAELIANGQPLALIGDNLFLDLDLSRDNLPIGSRLRLGTATLEVTPKPHNGCQKFQQRFGPGALRFVAKPEIRHRNLRGIYMRVVEAGEVGLGDPVEVLRRQPLQMTMRMR